MPADEPTVHLWGVSKELRRELAETQARVVALESRARDLAHRDGCTRLLTLDAFRASASRELARAGGGVTPTSLALVDIDDFRALNARRGPDAGDAALGAVAANLRAVTRKDDVLGRTGADEIAVLMPDTDLAGARACCERLIAQLEGADVPGAGCVTVSAGVAAHEAGHSIEQLLANAADGLDDARAAGGARAGARAPRPGATNPFRAQQHVVEALAMALLERDRYTGEHSAGVVDLARTVTAMLGMDEVEVERVGTAALLHDIGKVAIPDSILHKPERLDEVEWQLMREHPIIGERILRAIPALGGVARIVRHEHERFDGHGYPDRLAGEEIPIGSRIILACDAYHAMTSDRPYRDALAHRDAVAELARCAGTQFDPRVVAALVRHLGTLTADSRGAAGWPAALRRAVG